MSQDNSLARGAVVVPTAHTIPALKAGDPDPLLGVTVAEVLYSTAEFIVYIDTDNNLQWINQPREDAAWIVARAMDLEAHAGFMREVGGRSGVTQLRTAKRLIGQGVIAMLGGSARLEAESVFTTAQQFIESRAKETSRLWFFLPFIILAVFSALGVLIFAFNHCTRPFWSAVTCSLAGGLGAFLSRCLADRSLLPCDANAGRRTHVLEAFLRWAVGLGGGVVIWLMVHGQILLQGLDAKASAPVALLLLALLAGASERFLPTMLNRFDDQFEPKPKLPPPPGPTKLLLRKPLLTRRLLIRTRRRNLLIRRPSMRADPTERITRAQQQTPFRPFTSTQTTP